jgi:tRNA threonylcarbamoyladenosine biosynthesis protein TsaB
LRILAVETSGLAGSVAAMQDGTLLAELPLNPAQRGAQSLAPALVELLRQVAWKPHDAQVVAVSVGPGSFTALRVGVTTAKTFAYVVSADILGIGTLEAIAAQMADVDEGRHIATAIDAQRGDVYAALYRRRAAFDHEDLQAPIICRADDWIAGLTAETLVSGQALEKLADRLPRGIRVAPCDAWRPMASTIARLAAAKYTLGERGDVWKLAPLYLRKSAAEEKFV